MKKTFIVLLGIAGIIFLYCIRAVFHISPVTFPGSSSLTQEESVVLWIIDGDTLVVSGNGTEETVRLIGIDAPEQNKENDTKQCFFEESKEELRELTEGKSVSLESDETQEDRDVYGRLLRYVFLPDGTFVNRYMVERGLAKEYTYMGNPYMYQTDFIAAEIKAKEKKEGLWGACVSR